MKKIKKLLAFLLVITITITVFNLSFIRASAAFYTKNISDSTTITNILNLVKQNNGQDMYNKMYYIFYQSQFAAAYNKKFPYPNSGTSHNSVVDNGTTYKLEGSSRGCYLYADYVSKYVYGFGSWSSKCKSVWINQTAGSMTAQDVKNTITTHAQAGEHIYVAGNVHSVSFVAYDNNGFYYTDYGSDSNPYIYIHYTTWENFKNECNSKKQRACFLNFNLTPNSNSTNTTVTVQNFADGYQNEYYDTNAVLHGQVYKPKSYPITEFGIRIRKTSGSYSDSDAKFYKHTSNSAFNNYVEEDYARCWFDVNAELNIKLTHCTSYTYQIYAKVNGKEYFSSERTFSTTGSHSYGTNYEKDHPHRYYKKCSCGDWYYTGKNAADMTAATCTIASTCKICGVTSGSTLGHISDGGTITKEATCAATGIKTYKCTRCKITIKNETISKLNTHTYSSDSDIECDVCKESRTITHTYKTTITKATLSKNGSIVKKCTVCGNVASNTAIKYAKSFKLSTTTYTYNGKVITPSVVVKDYAGKTLKKNTDYTVTYASGRKNAGTYKVVVKMIGKYSGTKTLTFKINPAKISSYKLSTTSYTYNGKVKTPAVTVKNASGTKLTKNTHYTVTYASGRKNVGTYKVTIKGKGNYTGAKTLTFKINPTKTTVSKLTAGKKSIAINISKKSAQVSGYQIQYSTSKKFTSAKTKTISSYKTTKTTLKGLSAKKIYYVRVRTYKTVGKTKYYSGWSTYKYVKIK